MKNENGRLKKELVTVHQKLQTLSGQISRLSEIEIRKKIDELVQGLDAALRNQTGDD